jgi:hypothetical protein
LNEYRKEAARGQPRASLCPIDAHFGA